MKVLVLNDRASVLGGADNVAVVGAIAVARRGHDVTFFCAQRDDSVFPHDLIDRVVATGQKDILRNPSRSEAALQGLWNTKAAAMLDEELRRHQPDETVVHLHSWTKALSSSVVWTSLRRGFRVVCTLHDYFIACPNGSFFDFGKMRICPLTPLSARCIIRDCDSRSYPHKLWRVARQLVQLGPGKLPRGIENFITVSRFSTDVLAPYLPESARVHHVPNPIDVPLGNPSRPSSHDRFVMVGALHPGKGASMFLDALRRTGARGAVIGAETDLAGSLSDDCDVRIEGWLSSEDVLRRIRSARALVVPSLWYESQAVVVMEAASQGIPAIVPDTSAAKEFVEADLGGLWFRGGDVESLADRLRTLEADPDLADRLGRHAYESYWANAPTSERYAEALVGVYRTTLDG